MPVMAVLVDAMSQVNENEATEPDAPRFAYIHHVSIPVGEVRAVELTRHRT